MKLLINNFSLFEISYTCYSGWSLQVLNISTSGIVNIDDRALLSLSVSRDFVYLGLMFFDFRIYENNNIKNNWQ